MSRFSLILVALTLFFNSNVEAQKVINPNTIFWHKTEVTEIFPNKWGVGADFVYRRVSNLNSDGPLASPLRESIRPWVHYQFSPLARLSISPLGYFNSNTIIGSVDHGEVVDSHEWRSTIQYFHHQKVLGGKIMHTWRYRFEFRNLYRPNIQEYSYNTRLRVRYRLRYVLNGNDFYKDKTNYLAINNEIALNFGKNITRNTFSNNRFYLAVGRRFLNAARVELRYVNVFASRSNGFEFDQLQGFMLSLYIDQLSDLGRRKLRAVRFSN